ncbi:MAG: O-antigen/teichoic acid export membrane protein [Planctomycetota bacterium]|jgi:O-antigen/teichoic acid export membrane protein
MNGPRQETILESQVVLLLAHAVSLVIGLKLTIFLAEALVTSEFIDFVLLAGALALAGQFVDAGLQPAVTAELSRDPVHGQSVMWKIMKGRLFLAFIIFDVAYLASSLMPAGLNWILFLVTVGLLPLRTFGALFAAGHLLRFPALGNLTIRCVFFFILMMTALNQPLETLLEVVLVREIFLSLFPCLALLWRERVPRDSGPEEATSGAKGILFVAVATMFSAAYFHIDLFMLKGLAPADDVASYGLAVRLLTPIVVGTSLILAPFLPLLSKQLIDRMSPHFRDVLLIAITALGVIVPAILVLQLSVPGIDFIGEGKFALAAESLPLLSWSLFPIVFGMAFSTALIIAKRYREWLVITVIGLLLNLALNFFLIPRWGGLGAAWATIATEFAIALMAILVQMRLPSRASLFSSKEVGGACLATFAPGALALGVYLILWQPEAEYRLGLAVILAILAASIHLFFGVARTLRRRFEANINAGVKES